MAHEAKKKGLDVYVDSAVSFTADRSRGKKLTGAIV